jgi:hypothetical protein
LLLVHITSTKSSVTVCNAYRSPSLCITQFHDELADILTTVSASIVDHLLLCGDLNSRGSDAVSVIAELADVLDTFEPKQYVTTPTRYNRIMCSTCSLLSLVCRVDVAGSETVLRESFLDPADHWIDTLQPPWGHYG